MRLFSLLLLSVTLLVTAAFCQSADGIATSVSRTVTLTADQADFSVVAGADLDTNQQQISKVFSDAGISNLSLFGTSLSQNYDYSTNPPNIQTQILYQFTFTVPPAGMVGAAKIMETLRTKPPELLKSLQYTAALNASPSTVDAMRQTLLPQLFAEAQKKAQTVASAAGLKLGAIKSVSESFYSSGSSTNWIGSSNYGGTFSSTNGTAGTQYSFSAYVSFSVLP